MSTRRFQIQAYKGCARTHAHLRFQNSFARHRQFWQVLPLSASLKVLRKGIEGNPETEKTMFATCCGRYFKISFLGNVRPNFSFSETIRTDSSGQKKKRKEKEKTHSCLKKSHIFRKVDTGATCPTKCERAEHFGIKQSL